MGALIRHAYALSSNGDILAALRLSSPAKQTVNAR
jgi:hypothetical protein